MDQHFYDHVASAIAEVEASGQHKSERVLDSQQAARIHTTAGADVVNFCANNYLGLANDERLIQAAQAGLAKHGFGMASVRFIWTRSLAMMARMVAAYVPPFFRLAAWIFSISRRSSAVRGRPSENCASLRVIVWATRSLSASRARRQRRSC